AEEPGQWARKSAGGPAKPPAAKIENVNVKTARGPAGAEAAAGAALEALHEPQQRSRAEACNAQEHGVEVGRLAARSQRQSAVKAGRSEDAHACAGQFMPCSGQGLFGRSPSARLVGAERQEQGMNNHHLPLTKPPIAAVFSMVPMPGGVDCALTPRALSPVSPVGPPRPRASLAKRLICATLRRRKLSADASCRQQTTVLLLKLTRLYIILPSVLSCRVNLY